MKYLMLVCVEPGHRPDPDDPVPDIDEWVAGMDRAGVRLIGDRTRPDTDATTVRVRNREVVVTDGPYIETKDLMGGFDVLDCADLDEAIEVASKHPMAWAGVIELRPLWGDDD
jgi:hypothetical protein